ncbi:MAG: hypothetical protein F6J97_25245 [Leptolyngbya sp. SIO4C1]|nr:hypothetical protein [Leptolyngbya sp. SIO4C1]
MQHLSPFTCRRLNRLPKLISVWEGDRRHLSSELTSAELGEDSLQGDCILWVDGTQGIVRALSMVPDETGHESVVRTLLQAIEHPQGSVEPARPRKIVVKDRELQFFLRGALQDLDIEVDYAAELPLIDEIFDTLLQAGASERPSLPAAYQADLLEKAKNIWQDEPWYLLSEQEILAIELNQWDIQTLYVSVLGMADVEYGLLFYRELESLRQFRQAILSKHELSNKEIQQAFLSQDCLFINYEAEDSNFDLADASDSIRCDFGSIHPLEGLRTQLADEEAATLIVALEALHRFLKKHGHQLELLMLDPIESQFRIQNPVKAAVPKTVAVKVSTLPDITAELMDETETMVSEPAAASTIHDDLVPDGSLILLTQLSAEMIDDLQQSPKLYHQPFSPAPPAAQGIQKKSKPVPWPMLIIQTTRPKAKTLIEQLRSLGGVEALCFNPGSDPLNQKEFQLGLIKTQNGDLHLFHEYEMDNPTHAQALERWQTGQAKSQGRCGLLIAAGVSGAARGAPRWQDMMAFFETEAATPEQLDLQPLMLYYTVGLE